MKEELTTKMHLEFSVTRETETRHKVGCVIEIASKMNKTAEKDVIELCKLYGIDLDDINRWKDYWAKFGLNL